MKLLKPMVLLLLCTATLSLTAHAGSKGKPKENNKVPIDGGISALLIAGTAFGVKALAKKDKKSENTEA